VIGVLRISVGLALLALGRKLFWLFVGGMGFVAALGLATRLLGDMPEWMLILLAVVVGVIGTLLAVFLQKAAIGVAGFLGGGLLLIGALELFGLDLQGLWWLLALVCGGVAGTIVVAAAFEWALILLSSLAGASLIIDAAALPRPTEALIYLAALVFGVLVQAALYRRERGSG
jgi:hypothetical protein